MIAQAVATFLLLVSVAAPALAADSTSRPAAVAADPDLSALVAKLGSKDAAEQADAARQLESLGPRARPALIAAINGTSAAARSAASPLLLRLPFDRPQDPDDVRQLL